MEIAEIIIDILGFISAIVIFILTSKEENKTVREQTERERIRATLNEFAAIRRMNQDFSGGDARTVKNYLSELERFAVGCNMGAYDINVVNRMSGGQLVRQYRMYFKDYISEKRRSMRLDSAVNVANLYSECEIMLKTLFEMRGEKWDAPDTFNTDTHALYKFLSMPLSSSDEVFDTFAALDGAILKIGEGKQRFLYVPGKRKDRCLLLAHADTFFDRDYINKEVKNSLKLENGVYSSTSPECGIGADDRAGCAMLWLLRDSGHSLLILDGEEHGQVGSHYLKEHEPELFEEINSHTFMLQLDRRYQHDYRFYDLPVSDAFREYVITETGYTDSDGPGRTDIGTLAEKICAVNLSVGYYDEHTPNERLVVSEWENTLKIVRTMLAKPLMQYKMKKPKSDV